MSDNHLLIEEITDQERWQNLLDDLATSNTYTTWAWGEYKKRKGWNIHRVCINNENSQNVVACFQLQMKNIFSIHIMIIQGGIHLKDSSEEKYQECIQAIFEKYSSKKIFIIIINHQSGWSQDVQLGLLKSGFSPVLNTRMYTYVLEDESGSLDGQSLSSNWRHNLRRAQKNQRITVRWIIGLSERLKAMDRLENMYNNLSQRKNFAAAIDFNLAKDIIAENEKFHFAEALLDGEVIAARVSSECNDHVLDFIAASNEAAKKTYANYLLMWKMIEMTKKSGKKYFDVGGINPTENIGVYNFKKGLGGCLRLNGPVWLNGSGFFMKAVGRLLLSIRP